MSKLDIAIAAFLVKESGENWKTLVKCFCDQYPVQAQALENLLVAVKKQSWKEAADWLEKNVSIDHPGDSPREDLTKYLQGYRDSRKKAAKALRIQIESGSLSGEPCEKKGEML